ncbi:hypothetical protein PGT21_023997 [Puccinia graminis f. sp. tritici]|uniref:Uncharacterized protein n=1 Tax=Puccinia graminis f. sp. tritici TaxID=56615 RepID=A0A5B0R1J7_PUCGR|nr:hypothetical protein PGT21_023997 [Puccinia graminis f. sp. tritici]
MLASNGNFLTTTSLNNQSDIEEISLDSTANTTNSSAESGHKSQGVASSGCDGESDTQVKKRKLTSKVWEHFERVIKGNMSLLQSQSVNIAFVWNQPPSKAF